MAKNPEKTIRNKKIKSLTSELQDLQAKVLEETGRSDVKSLHGLIGGKNAKFIDLRRTVIRTPIEFVSLWLKGYKEHTDTNQTRGIADALTRSSTLKRYLFIFLQRTFLNEFEALSRHRPDGERAEVWIGSANKNYGLLVTPRFVNGRWENDKSEIRHFKEEYWTIGHVLKTGIVTPDDPGIITFQNVESYLIFFKNVLVRASGSPHEKKIAEMYIDFIRSLDNPNDIPLLIPEFRYKGRTSAHGEHRLDFTIISEFAEHSRVGFELSPWSTHGKLVGTANKTQSEINEEAKTNFEREMNKHKKFFKEHDIFVRIYTDNDLKNMDDIFNDIKKYLAPVRSEIQLEFELIKDILDIELAAE